ASVRIVVGNGGRIGFGVTAAELGERHEGEAGEEERAGVARHGLGGRGLQRPYRAQTLERTGGQQAPEGPAEAWVARVRWPWEEPLEGELQGLLALVDDGGLVVVGRLGAGLDRLVGLLDLLVDHRLERVDRLRPRQVAAVDEEGRGAANAELRQHRHA